MSQDVQQYKKSAKDFCVKISQQFYWILQTSTSKPIALSKMQRIISMALLFTVALSSPAPYIPLDTYKLEKAKAELRKVSAEQWKAVTQQYGSLVCALVEPLLEEIWDCTPDDRMISQGLIQGGWIGCLVTPPPPMGLKYRRSN